MSSSIRTISIDSYVGQTIKMPLYQQDEPQQRLLVLLPGRGYRVEHPLLFYMQQIGSQLGWDVLAVSYGFQLTQYDFTPDDMHHLLQESQQALQTVLDDGDYREVVIVGKSLGSPLAVTLAQQLDDSLKTSLILLTPIQNSVELVKDIPTTAVIGTADPYYDAKKTATSDIVTWHVYEKLDHGLQQPDDWQTSLLMLNKIMEVCANALERESS